MKNEKKLKEYETVWTCDYCGEEFKTKKESGKHESICKKNPTNKQPSKLISIFKSIIIIPFAFIFSIFNFTKQLIVGGKVPLDDVSYKYTRGQYFISSIIFFSIIGYFIYQNQFTKVYYVYACPSSGTSKCYKVEADYNSGECEEIEYDMRGSSGGSCTDDSFNSITFPNTGYITFDYCDKNSKDKWTCYAEDSNDGSWDIQLAKVVKVKK